MTPTARPKVAFFDFTGCEGCQLTVIDALQTHPELLEVIEIVQFREAMSETSDDYQIAFVEGACSRSSDETRLQVIREQAEMVVALGACAHLGGVNAIRNSQNQDIVRRYVYGEAGKRLDSCLARPIDSVIAVDAFIPGCPIDRGEFIRSVTRLLQGRQIEIPDYPVCVECKRRETACLYLAGEPCLGPVIRAGCGAICPAYGVGCQGCRGLIPDPNLKWMRVVLAEHGVTESEIAARLRLFMTYPIMEDGRM